MKNQMSLFIAVLAGALLGFGMFALWTEDESRLNEDNGQTDVYEGWSTVSPGNIITLRIPPGCEADAGTGSMYIVCEEESGEDPLPSMVISSDGVLVNIRRWEETAWEHWDKVIDSLRVVTPVDHDISISIQE